MLGTTLACLVALLGLITIGGGAWGLFKILQDIRLLFHWMKGDGGCVCNSPRPNFCVTLATVANAQTLFSAISLGVHAPAERESQQPN
jgi:hypothetical protein